MRVFLFAFFVILFQFQDSFAFSVQPYVGTLSYAHLDGCCQSSGSKIGTGIRVRMTLDDAKEWDLFGYTDRRWSEFAILKPAVIHGTYYDKDPAPFTESIRVARMSYWNWIFSYGGGYFIHSTRTLRYDLPAITSGFSLLGQSQWNYTLDDKYSLFAMLHLGIGLATDEKGYLYGAFLGGSIRL